MLSHDNVRFLYKNVQKHKSFLKKLCKFKIKIYLCINEITNHNLNYQDYGNNIYSQTLQG